jgi:hypothetical protein
MQKHGTQWVEYLKISNNSRNFFWLPQNFLLNQAACTLKRKETRILFPPYDHAGMHQKIFLGKNTFFGKNIQKLRFLAKNRHF